MSFDDLPNELLVHILKNVNRRRDMLKMCGLNTRIDSIIKNFNLLPQGSDTLYQLLEKKQVDVIKKILDFTEAGDLWCIAGSWCAVKNDRIFFCSDDIIYINLFYFKHKRDVISYKLINELRDANVNVIGVQKYGRPSLSDFIADILYSFKYTIDSIAYNHELDDFVTVDRPAYWHAPYISSTLKSQRDLNIQLTRIRSTGPFGYKEVDFTVIGINYKWNYFSNINMCSTKRHIMRRCNILEIMHKLTRCDRSSCQSCAYKQQFLIVFLKAYQPLFIENINYIDLLI